jgi:hypothetical protein
MNMTKELTTNRPKKIISNAAKSTNLKALPKKPVNKNPGVKIRPMAAWELREMLKLKGPPRRNPNIEDSAVFRETNGPEGGVPSMFRGFQVPTNRSHKVTKEWDGSDNLMRQDEFETQQEASQERKGDVKDALAKLLSDDYSFDV